MKKITLLFCLSFIGFVGFSQSNGINVRTIISPVQGFNYDSSATANIEIRFENNGPNDLFAQDSIHFGISIGHGVTTEFHDIRQVIGITMNPSQQRDFVLIPNYDFKVENDYIICITADRTDLYPVNDTKNPRKCVSFVVGVNDEKIDIEKIFFANNQLNFQLNKPFNSKAVVYDITGKVLLNEKLLNQNEQIIEFSNRANGFYFLKVINDKGQSTISKFIVN
jgi:hypothetical protein